MQNEQFSKPIHKVVSGGVTIHWTTSLKQAQEAYNEASKRDKQHWLVQPDGTAKLLAKA